MRLAATVSVRRRRRLARTRLQRLLPNASSSHKRGSPPRGHPAPAPAPALSPRHMKDDHITKKTCEQKKKKGLVVSPVPAPIPRSYSVPYDVQHGFLQYLRFRHLFNQVPFHSLVSYRMKVFVSLHTRIL